MGDIKHLRKKYKGPSHPWNRNVIEEEKKLLQEFGLRRKHELYKATSFMKKYKDIAKKLIADRTIQGTKEKALVLQKLQRLGLLQEGAKLDDILNIELRNILERRAQSRIYRKGLAKTMAQARQMIVHGHILVGDAPITFPSYLVSLTEEEVLHFSAASQFIDAEHPERLQAVKDIKEEAASIKEGVAIIKEETAALHQKEAEKEETA